SRTAGILYRLPGGTYLCPKVLAGIAAHAARHRGDRTSVTTSRRRHRHKCRSVAVGPECHFTDRIENPRGQPHAYRGRMPAPHWFFRFMYDCESAAWARGRDEPEQHALVERTAEELAGVVAPPGPVADLGCGPGAHALALARRGYDVVGVDGSPRMVE